MKGNILLGISGGIAAYKIPDLVSLLVQQNYRVRVVLSSAGASFVSSETLACLSAQETYSNLWQTHESKKPVLHVALVDEADIFLIAPATYDWIGKAAHGLADDLLSTLFAAWPLGKKPLLFAPAMNPEMWHKAILQQNIHSLEQQGCQMLEPAEGFLACRAEGQGRMLEIGELYFRLESALRFRNDTLKQKYQSYFPLRGKKILLSAGATREALDPVRYISNRSSGKSGIALACAARDLGAEVTFISSIETSPFAGQDVLAQQLFGIRILHCRDAQEMAGHATEHFPSCDWAFAVAAVCDFRPLQIHEQKMKKPAGNEAIRIEFQLNPDILAHWGQHKTNKQKVLGFALESEGPAERDYGLAKLHHKKADAIVLNRPDNLERNQAQAQVIFAPSDGTAQAEYSIGRKDKYDFAGELLLLLCEHWL
ncbi:MAG: bifunctional phosphopantothenoylcysteine decarboxylase/phosphopantothenate--cysteine ligase CoaBC [Spirochaetota bacterium]